jgi:ribosomal protein S18 acetylase RimI-like enzyme
MDVRLEVEVEEADLTNARHAEAIVEIIDSYARGPGGQNSPLSDFAKERLVTGLIEHPMAEVLLAIADERIVGLAVCVYSFSTFAGRPSVNIHDLAVLPDFRGRGAGHALLDEVDRRGRERGCCKVTLEVHDTNDGAKRLYAAAGFGPLATGDQPTLFVTKML